jgi:DNA mismatch repair protein MutL
MYPSIKRLDPLLSSQIAAGEVIERPASVVKELVENSIDAGADRISIEIVDGGTRLIRVSDNGRGMTREDALLSLERFATSKIGSIDDLDSIATLGFRGEALPSIASCSRLTLETKTADGETGTCVRVDGGAVVDVTEKGLPQGTTITVTDLFFNTPARLKFLKSQGTERNAVIETVERLALAWPNISFTLMSQGRAVLHTTGKGLEDALANIFGTETIQSMVEVSSDHGGIRISGFAGLPRVYRRIRDRQLFAVNRRPVKNTCLGWALDHAYAGLLPPKTYPVAVLELTVEPGALDVNVHPTKAEIKFGNEVEIRRRITQSVKQALSQAGYLNDPGTGPGRYSHPEFSSPKRESPQDVIQSIWQMQTQPLSLHEKGPQLLSDNEDMCEWQYLGSLQDMYLVAKTSESLLIIDQHALAESLAYHSLCQGESGSQELLLPEVVQLEPTEAVLYQEYGDELEQVGFSSRPVGTRTVLVTKVPLILGQPLPAVSLRGVLMKAYEGSPRMSPGRVVAQAQIATAACHASIKAKQPLTKEEAQALIRCLWAKPGARTCPHGRPTVHEIPFPELARFFGR